MNEHDLYVNQWIRIHEAKVHKKRDERLSRVVLHERLCSVRLIKRKRKAVTAKPAAPRPGNTSVSPKQLIQLNVQLADESRFLVKQGNGGWRKGIVQSPWVSASDYAGKLLCARMDRSFRLQQLVRVILHDRRGA